MPFTPKSLAFLKQLKRNNRREWFQPRKEEYEALLLQPMRDLVEDMDVQLAAIAPEFVGDPRRSIFRIYRDVRFSKDKSPYKTHIAAWFRHRRASQSVGTEAESGGAGIYVHVEPGGCMVAGGIWMPARPVLNRLRDAIGDAPATFEKTLAGAAFRKRFGALSEEKVLTRVPRGFAPDHPAARWLRYASFTVSAPLTDAQVCAPGLAKALARDVKLMLPLVRWLNSGLGFPPESQR
jgi:uncharacterized protein (TIGR02453 family)